MQTERLSKLLRDISFSADLPDELMQKLAAISHVREFPKGTILFEEGTANSDLYLIWSGRLALDLNVPTYGNIRILSLGPGDIVGWSSILDVDEMTASAVVTEDSEVVCVPAVPLLRECQNDPALGYEIMRRVAQQLARRLLATRVRLLELIPARQSKT